MMNEGRRFLALIRAVARLAMPASEQLAYLAQIGVGDLADELALEVTDNVDIVPVLVSAGWLETHEAELILELDRLLDDLSDNAEAETWRTAGITTDQRWAEVRSVARHFLNS